MRERARRGVHLLGSARVVPEGRHDRTPAIHRWDGVIARSKAPQGRKPIAVRRKPTGNSEKKKPSPEGTKDDRRPSNTVTKLRRVHDRIAGPGAAGLAPNGAAGCSHGWSSPQANGTRGTARPRDPAPERAEESCCAHGPGRSGVVPEGHYDRSPAISSLGTGSSPHPKSRRDG